MATGKLIGLVGPIGCGKTTLLLGLLGQLIELGDSNGIIELSSAEGTNPERKDGNYLDILSNGGSIFESGSLEAGGRVAYAAQKPWLCQGAVLSAITFLDEERTGVSRPTAAGAKEAGVASGGLLTPTEGVSGGAAGAHKGSCEEEEDARGGQGGDARWDDNQGKGTSSDVAAAGPPPCVDEEWLWRVVDACGLRPDIEEFKDGLLHLVGDAGGALSGELSSKSVHTLHKEPTAVLYVIAK